MDTTRALVPLLVGLLAAGSCVAAEDEAAPPAVVESRAAPADGEHSATEDSDASAAVVARPVAAASARWSVSGAPTEEGYRLSVSRGPLDLGLHFESRLVSSHPVDGRYDSAAPPGATLPALSIGLRSVGAGPASASSLAARALGSTSSVPYVSKVGIEWKPAQSPVFFNQLNQGLGVHLGGDDRLVMRMRKGSLGVYMHRNF
jgi:hypothetical protein